MICLETSPTMQITLKLNYTMLLEICIFFCRHPHKTISMCNFSFVDYVILKKEILTCLFK